MKIYLVGGAVRDELLGRVAHDRDYCVVGATEKEMLKRGFKQVGASFPVFLHPKSGDAYALARKERKTAPGHRGFLCEFDEKVTLKDDLARRDFTINAIAKDVKTGEFFDFFGGMDDIKNKILRHTTDAFLEDPLRILRLFRFKAQLGREWQIYPKTLSLALENAHTLAEISPERKWKEFEKALNSQNFTDYVRFLSEIGELDELYTLKNVPQSPKHHPEGDAFTHTLLALGVADALGVSAVGKFATLCHDWGKSVVFAQHGRLYGHDAAGEARVKGFCERLRVPSEFCRAAVFVAKNHTNAHRILPHYNDSTLRPATILRIFEEAGDMKAASARRLVEVLGEACMCDALGRGGVCEAFLEFGANLDSTKTAKFGEILKKANQLYPQREFLLRCFEAATSVETRPLVLFLKQLGKEGSAIGEAIRAERVKKIAEVVKCER